MTDLTDRMRTCAAFIMSRLYDGADDTYLGDAADLLIEASNLLEAVAQPQYPPGVPMEIIPPVVALPSDTPITGAAWIAPGGLLPVARPYRSLQACPKCDSRANKRVRRDGNRLMLICPVCAETWEYKP